MPIEIPEGRIFEPPMRPTRVEVGRTYAAAQIRNWEELAAFLSTPNLGPRHFMDNVLPQREIMQYTGDGQANREIPLPFVPRYARIQSHGTGLESWEVWHDGAVVQYMILKQAGNGTRSVPAATEFRGVGGVGLLLGTAAGNAANANGIIYTVWAWR